MKRIVLLACAAAMAAASGCSSNSAKQAGQGATMGAVGGAVAGAVSSLLWGGNVVEGAVKGGITGAATGAAVGAVSGSMADSQQAQAQQQAGQARQQAGQAQQPDPKVAELRKRIGERNYASALMLAQCQHKDAISSAEETFNSTQDRDQRVYALMIEGVAAEESGDKARAASVYPRISQLDSARGSPDKLRADALEAVIKVQSARRQHGLPATCA
jgi:hypothetical protein